MSAPYQASHRKRYRSTKAEIEQRRDGLYSIVESMKPMTVRQVYYQATVRDIVEKDEAGYNKVQTDLVQMRKAGALPYEWLADNTRWQRKPRTFYSVEEALNHTARFYRKALWADIDTYVEVWLEKDALAGVVLPITSEFDVSLMVARGYASLSFLHSAADYIASLDVATHIYHFGDFDPSGVNAGEKIEQTLKEMAPTPTSPFNASLSRNGRSSDTTSLAARQRPVTAALKVLAMSASNSTRLIRTHCARLSGTRLRPTSRRRNSACSK